MSMMMMHLYMSYSIDVLLCVLASMFTWRFMTFTWCVQQAASTGSRVMVMATQRPSSPSGKIFAEQQKNELSASLQDTALLESPVGDDGASSLG